MAIKRLVKRMLLKLNKSIYVDKKSRVSYQIINKSINKEFPCRINDSICNAIEVAEGCTISETRCYGNIRLGRFVSISGPGTVINAIKEEVVIGSFTSIGQNVCIVDFNHSFNKVTSSFIKYKIFHKNATEDVITKGPVVIEEDVWIGSNTVIMPGIIIGRGSIIGSGSIVTKGIPRYSIVFGNPAKIHSMRFSDSIIEFLEDLRWWEWSIKKIQNNKHFFSVLIKEQDLEKLKDKIK